jgi:hypothetical protein
MFGYNRQSLLAETLDMLVPKQLAYVVSSVTNSPNSGVATVMQRGRLSPLSLSFPCVFAFCALSVCTSALLPLLFSTSPLLDLPSVCCP